MVIVSFKPKILENYNAAAPLLYQINKSVRPNF